MTLEERAEKLVWDVLMAGTTAKERTVAASALTAAIRDERQRCARVARGAAASGPAVAVVAEHIARRIESGEEGEWDE